MANSNENFEVRNSGENIAEILFEQYCTKKGYKFYRLGFDEKNKRIANFHKLNFIVRNLPDYLIDMGNELRLIQVKGTPTFKTSEYKNIPLFIDSFETKEVSLQYAFCFRPSYNEEFKPIFVYADTVIKLYDEGKPGVYNDGVEYRLLNFDKR